MVNESELSYRKKIQIECTMKIAIGLFLIIFTAISLIAGLNEGLNDIAQYDYDQVQSIIIVLITVLIIAALVISAGIYVILKAIRNLKRL